MASFRFLLALLVAWLILIFNLERPDMNFLGFTYIDIDSFVYVVFAFIATSLILLPDIARRAYITYIPAMIVYLIAKLVIGSPMAGTYLPITITEIALTLLTIALFRQVSLVITNFEQVVENVLLKPDNLHILSATEGEEQINHELFRARRFERPVSFLLVRPNEPSTVDDPLSVESVLQQRYVEFRIAKIIQSLTYKGDTITLDNGDLIVCLPETSREQAIQLGKRVFKQILARQKIQVRIGKAEFPHDGLIYAQLVDAAREDIKYFEPDTITSEFPVIKITDEPAIAETSISEEIREVTKSDRRSDLEIHSQSPASFVRVMRNVFDPLPHVGITSSGAAVLDDLGDPDFWVYDVPYQSAASKAVYRFVKRAMDLALVILSLPFVLPLTGILALIIKLQDGGAIFFTQKRTGLGGNRFHMYKFRTMVPDAEEQLKKLAAEGKAVLNTEGKLAQPLKLDRDPRVTKLGRILRKTSLDELPQLFNVLRGDMSLVGPRPTSWGLDSYSLLHTERLSVRPGITGLWQVCARGGTDFDDWVEWDMAYLDRMCLSLDTKILLQTFVKVFKRSGAR